jgi:hypothetical protein
VAFVSKSGLQWSLKKLAEWKSSPQVKRSEWVPSFFALKYLGIGTNTELLVSGQKFTQVIDLFFRVSYQNEPSATRTGEVPHYFNPFGSDYSKAKRAGSSSSGWPVGTLYTRLKDLGGFVSVVNYQRNKPYRVRLAENYVTGIMGDIGSIPIPALALAGFVFRRPTDSSVDLSGIESLDAVLQVFLQVFHIHPSEHSLFNLETSSAPSDFLTQSSSVSAPTSIVGNGHAPQEQAASLA